MNGIIASSRRVDTDKTVPSVPTGLSSSSRCQTSFTLTWNASTDNVGIAGYRIYRNGTLWVDSAGTSTSENITGQSAGATNTWTVSAYDAANNESSQSSGLGVTQGVSVTPFTTTNPARNAASACLSLTSFTRYLTGGNSTPANGEVVYSDACGTIKLNGADDFYSDGLVSFQISSTGVISNVSLC